MDLSRGGIQAGEVRKARLINIEHCPQSACWVWLAGSFTAPALAPLGRTTRNAAKSRRMIIRFTKNRFLLLFCQGGPSRTSCVFIAVSLAYGRTEFACYSSANLFSFTRAT